MNGPAQPDRATEPEAHAGDLPATATNGFRHPGGAPGALATLRRWAPAYWSGRHRGAAIHLLDAALAPAEAIFRGAVRTRSAWHDRTAAGRLPIPVASVGNLTVGGTGKTPVVRWLGEWLRARGVATAIVTRGYGGDETELHRGWFGADAVRAGRDRRGCVREAAALGFVLALVDDGFQHRSLARDLDVLLVAAEDSPNYRMLPRGPGREPVGAAARADFVLITRRAGAGDDYGPAWRRTLGRTAPRTPVLEAALEMDGWRDLGGRAIPPPRGDILAVCSVARPGAFGRGLARRLPTASIELLDFPDHYRYRRRDAEALLAHLGGRTIVCTGKDAVKLRAFSSLEARCAVVGFGVRGDPPSPLREALLALAGGP